MKTQRIILKVGERLEICYTKRGYTKHFSSVAVGTADQGRQPEQRVETSARVTMSFIGPASLCLVKERAK